MIRFQKKRKKWKLYGIAKVNQMSSFIWTISFIRDLYSLIRNKSTYVIHLKSSINNN